MTDTKHIEPELITMPKTKRARDAYTKAAVCLGIKTQINQFRKERGWTQAELGKRAGMPPNVISRLERPDDKLISMRTLIRIANAFDLPVAVQFGEEQRFYYAKPGLEKKDGIIRS